MSIVRLMFYESFGTQNWMLTFVCKFDPRKGQCQVRLGQIKSNFQVLNFTKKTCLSCPVLPQKYTDVINFYVRQLEMTNVAFAKCDVTFTCFFFFAIVQSKTKILLSNYVRLLLVCFLVTRFPFFG